MLSSPEPLRRPHESASQSTDDASAELTPSPRSSSSTDGLPIIDGADAYELRPLARLGDATTRPGDNNGLRVPYEDTSLLPSPRRFSTSSVQSYELYTPDEDRGVLRKLDRRLVSFMAVLYCLSFLDRSSR